MRLLALRYTDSPSTRAFYEAFGLQFDAQASAPDWQVLLAGQGAVALHPVPADKPEKGPVEFCFEADEPLSAVQERLAAAGLPGGEITEEDFGFALRLVDPDGFAFQVNGYAR